MYEDKELQEYRDLLQTPEHFEEGFDWKTVVGAIFIGFLMMLVVFWRALVRSPRTVTAQVPGARPTGPQAWFDLAEGLFYHQGHTWVFS